MEKTSARVFFRFRLRGNHRDTEGTESSTEGGHADLYLSVKNPCVLCASVVEEEENPRDTEGTESRHREKSRPGDLSV